MKTHNTVTLIDPNVDNIEAIFEKIKGYASEKGYRVIGDLSIPKNMLGIKKAPKFESKSQLKKVRNYLTKLDKGISLERCNRFMHMLFKHIYQLDKPAPRVDYSEKECEIKAACKAYRKADAEALKLLKAYKEVKGNFYKTK